jgi:hypothetical protein
MAAEMQRRGHRLLTDDVLAVAPDTLSAYSAFPQLKLHAETVGAIGQSIDLLPRIHPDITKYALRGPLLSFASTSRPLRAVFVLAVGDHIRCQELSGREALIALLSQSFAPRFLGTEGHSALNLQKCTALAQQVSVFRLERPRDLDSLPAVATCVESAVGRSTRTGEKQGT